jgi:hypothetical protein
MVVLRCEWLDEQMISERSGFDLGHMTFSGEKGICTSRGKSPDQAMMLAIAITDLLYGLETLLRGAQSEYRFVGADSSFSVWFKKTKRGRISLRSGTTELGEAEPTDLCKSILQGVETFFALPGNELPINDPVREDLLSSIQSFKRCLREG